MPNSVTIVKKGAFDGAEKLKKVRFSKNLKRPIVLTPFGIL